MLEVAAITAGYGAVRVLDRLSLTAAAGEVTCLMGRNGAGKSTLLKAIMGLVRLTSGEIRLAGTRIDTLPDHKVPLIGIGYVPQGRRLWGELTVAETLELGLRALRLRGRGPAEVVARRAEVLALFPRLAERLSQVSRTLSGGEQQMLAVARALCLDPKLLLLDEPTEGLQPSMISLIGDTTRALRQNGVAVVLVEQRVDAVLELADRVAFVVSGRVAQTCPASELTAASPEFHRYVGV